MKIAMLTTAMPGFSGEAISKNVSIMSMELQRMGHSVRILTLFRTMEEFRGFRSSSNPMVFPYYFILSKRRLRNALNVYHPDFLLTHFGLLGTSFLLPEDFPTTIFVYPYPSSIKEYLHLQQEMIRFGFSSGISHYTHLLSFALLNNPKIYKMSLKRSSLAIFCSEDLKKTYGAYACRSGVLNLAFGEDEFEISEKIIQNRSSYREKWNLSERDVAIGFLGNSPLLKGVDRVISTFANLCRSRKEELKLFLALSPLEEFNVRKILRKAPIDIRRRTSVFSQVNALEFIGVLDLLLFPLRSHIGTTAVPRTILEAMLVGTPSIVSSVNPSIRQLYSGSKFSLILTSLHRDLLSKSSVVLDNLESFRKLVLLERRKTLPAHRARRVAKELVKMLLHQ